MKKRWALRRIIIFSLSLFGFGSTMIFLNCRERNFLWQILRFSLLSFIRLYRLRACCRVLSDDDLKKATNWRYLPKFAENLFFWLHSWQFHYHLTLMMPRHAMKFNRDLIGQFWIMISPFRFENLSFMKVEMPQILLKWYSIKIKICDSN